MSATPEKGVSRDRALLITVLAVIVAALAASAVILARDGGSVDEPLVARTDPHAPREVSKDVLNAVDKITRTTTEVALVARGRDLFRSSAVALSGESCQSCHTDGAANKDVGTTPHGIGDPTLIDQSFVGPRDPPTLFNVGRTDPYFWNGDVETLQEVAVATILNHFKPEFKDDVPAGEVDTQAAALTAYMETIKPPTTAFDRGTMSAAALRGLELFQGKAGCVACHGGADFTDNLIHNTLVRQVTSVPFTNATSATGQPRDFGAKKPAGANAGKTCPMTLQDINPLDPLECGVNTPTLRGNGLAGTAPFMHNGFCTASASALEGDPAKCDTLREVVFFYNNQSVVAPLRLTPQEEADLVEFLKQL